MPTFPHLDTNSKFPYLDNVEVYKYDNNFDYSRFDYDQMEIIVCSVPWDMGEAHIGNRTISGIGNVVDFGGKDERDQWFADLPADECFRFSTKYRQLHRENKIGVPIPFDVASNYNYVAVEYKPMAHEGSPIDYEREDARRKWFWFIREVEFVGPNSTVLHLMIDAWQTFIYDLDIVSMVLERGHAPMAAIRADEYLQNPIENNAYLLCEDVNYGDDSVIRDCEYLPIGNGRKFCLFALPMMQSNITATGAAMSGNTSPATYIDEVSRWGHQLIVSGYEWSYVPDYSGVNAPFVQSLMHKSDFVFNGNGVFAIESENASSFFNALAANYMHIFQAIQAVFIVDEEHLRIDSQFTLAGFTVYNVTSKNTVHNITLTSDMFNYPDEYKEIAKLYTFPYATLEYTDDDGLTVELKIENTGKLSIVHELAIVFPYVQQRVYLRGVNGSKTDTYTWRNIGNNSDTRMTLPVDDFSKFMSKWNIPTFALYVRRDRMDAPGDYASMQARRERALIDYKNTVRIANTMYENASDTQDTNVANIGASGATNTANIQRTTAKDVDNVARVQVGMVDNTSDINATQTDIVENLQYAGSFGPFGGGFVNATTWANFEKISDDADTDWAVIQQGLGSGVQYAVGMATNNIATQVAGGAITTGALAATGNVPGAVMSGLSTGVSAVSTGISTGIAITNDSNLAAIQQQAIIDKISHARTLSQKTVDAKQTYDIAVKNSENGLRTSQTNRFSGTSGINNTNAQADKTALDANAADTQATDNSNAVRTKNTTVNNEDWSRDAIVVGAKADLEQKQLEEKSRWLNRAKSAPVVMTSYTGDAMQDVFKRRGVRLNVRTQSKSAIKCAGDEFLRYGYMLEQQWDFDGNWNVLPYFTYWKLRDFWIRSLNVPDAYVDRIRFFLFGGVTVWSKPEYIGHKTIYENYADFRSGNNV